MEALLLCLLLAASPAPQRTRPRELNRPNVVMIVIDDMGVDKVGAYQDGPVGVAPPCTPNMDAMAAAGVLFRNAYTNPVCSPTRAQILTGRHAYRTGVGMGIPVDGSSLGLEARLEAMLPRELHGYETSAVGKWHLMSLANGDRDHPLESGFNFYSGSLFNIRARLDDDPLCVLNGPLGYENWVKTEDLGGSASLESTCLTSYATTDTADDAIARAQLMRAPWFLYVSFNAAHLPVHIPPAGLCHPGGTCAQQYCPGDGSDDAVAMNAIVEALDSEIGRMMQGIRAVDPEPFVFLIGDNGTPGFLAMGQEGGCFAPDRGKATLFESGINVPLIVTGPGVVPGECEALVQSTDLYDTLTRLAYVPARAEDSVSLLPYLFGDMRPRRRTVYNEIFFPNQPSSLLGRPFQPEAHLRAIQDERFKLVRLTTPGVASNQLYDLVNDPCEQVDLFSASQSPGSGPLDPETLSAYRRLRSELVSMGVY